MASGEERKMKLSPIGIAIIGTWILSDAIYSILLYLSADGHSGKPQTWKRDHWVRVVRGLLGLIMIWSVL